MQVLIKSVTARFTFSLKLAPQGLLFITQKERFPSTAALTTVEQSLRHPAI